MLDNLAKAKSPRLIRDGISEHEIHTGCVKWFRVQYPQYATVLIHPANEGKRSTKVFNTKYGTRVVCTGGARLKEEGLVPGVADLLLLVPSAKFHGLCIEMKSATGKQSPMQKKWQEAVEAQGYRYAVCRSLEEFVSVVDNYLRNHD